MLVVDELANCPPVERAHPAASYSTCSSLCLDTAVFPASLFPNNSGLIEYSATDL